MRVVLQSVFCCAKMSALGASMPGPRRVLCLNVIVQVGGLGDQLAHCALPLAAPQSNHHRPDYSFDICDVRLLSEGTNICQIWTVTLPVSREKVKWVSERDVSPLFPSAIGSPVLGSMASY